MKVLWISGWAVPPEWLVHQAQTAWPEVEHLGTTPTDAATAVKAGGYDVLGGYSLGALWLLRNAAKIPVEIPVILLAPIFAFTAEKHRGGKIALAQLRLQRRRLRSQPEEAVADFFQRAGLAELANNAEALAWNEERTAELDAELGWLEAWEPPPPPRHWRGIAGRKDFLINASEIKNFWPELRILPNADHAPGSLLRAAPSLFLPSFDESSC